jgi:putative restriction endonuclease
MEPSREGVAQLLTEAYRGRTKVRCTITLTADERPSDRAFRFLMCRRPAPLPMTSRNEVQVSRPNSNKPRVHSQSVSLPQTDRGSRAGMPLHPTDEKAGMSSLNAARCEAVIMWSAEREARLRSEAIAWLTVRTQGGMNALTTDDIRDFTFEGERFRLLDRQRGITKPAGLAFALSIRTVWRPEGTERPYDDAIGGDGFIRYKWRGNDPDQADNRALRAAMFAGQPLIWFWGVGTGLYQAIFPIYLVDEEPNDQQFVVATDGLQHLKLRGSPIEETLRRYLRSETLRRLHQPVFRGMIMRAYEGSCAVCSLRHSELLDAAHIVPDRHELGVAAIRNGLALCKIHHAAYDAGILGVRPDLIVQIRGDILEETDGPLLEYGLKALHGQRLRVVPNIRRERPDGDLLALRYDQFRAS